MPVRLVQFDLPVPDDVTGLEVELRSAAPNEIQKLAVFVKVGGEYEDGSRERARAAVDEILSSHGLLERSEMVTVIGCEGASTPCGYALLDTGDDATTGTGERLAIGLGRMAPGPEDVLDTAQFASRVAAAVTTAIEEAGIEPAEVVTVIVNVPQPTSGDYRVRGRRARAAAALGAGIAVGDIPEEKVTDAAIAVDPDLYTRRVQTYIGPTVRNIEVIAIANRPGAGGNLVACSTVTSDLLDTRPIKRMLLDAGLRLDKYGEFEDVTRVKAILVKAGVKPDGTVAGAPTTIFNSATPPEKHVRAALSGALGALLRTTRMFSTFDPIQQAPLGGGAICCILEAEP